MVCLRAEAATPNSRASLKSLLFNKLKINPEAKESPPPTLSTILTSYFLELLLQLAQRLQY